MICARWSRNCCFPTITTSGNALSLHLPKEIKQVIIGPTFEEMLHPEKIAPETRRQALKARHADPLDPVNLYNITWRDANNAVYHVVLPRELTGVDANIVVIYGREFPSGSHKVGAAYSVLLEKVLFGEVDAA